MTLTEFRSMIWVPPAPCAATTVDVLVIQVDGPPRTLRSWFLGSGPAALLQQPWPFAMLTETVSFTSLGGCHFWVHGAHANVPCTPKHLLSLTAYDRVNANRAMGGFGHLLRLFPTAMEVGRPGSLKAFSHNLVSQGYQLDGPLVCHRSSYMETGSVGSFSEDVRSFITGPQ